MGRSSLSKATRPKADARFFRIGPNGSFPEELIGLLASLPDPGHTGAPESGDTEEPPRKRARVEGQLDAVTVGKSSIVFAQRCPAGARPIAAFQCPDISRLLRVQADMVDEGQFHSLKSLTLSTLSRSPFGQFTFEIFRGRGDRLSEDLHNILDVLRRNRDSVDSEGAILISIHVSFERLGPKDTLALSFEVKWNQSRNMFKGLRNKQQRKISDIIQDRFVPNLTSIANEVETTALTPQAFYEAAYMTDETYTGLRHVEVPNLEASLYPFQRRALQWLLQREGVRWAARPGEAPGIEPCPVEDTSTLPLSFREVQDFDGNTFYHSELFHVVTTDVGPWRDLESTLKGGILAEEMGLGKTVETISLILFHRRSAESQIIHDYFTNTWVKPTGATLIVTPETLKRQWVSEFTKHAPALRVMVYEGRKSHKQTEDELTALMCEHDVVVTTYNVLRTEIHFARPEPDRSRRHERQQPRASSPLVKLSWWRVCLDEAQQIESGVSAAAEVARLVPRINAWGITGTPVKEKIKDLWGLLLFLRYEPFASYPVIWDALVSGHPPIFADLFKRLALRHTKHAVRHELVLPPQKRYVITMPFTAVEEQHYRTCFKDAVEEAKLDTAGKPLSTPDMWEISTPNAVDAMRRALVSLRQTVLHPQLGPRKGRPLGQASKALKTIDEVLDAMIEHTDNLIRTNQRSRLTAKLVRGQLLENSPRVREALAIWEEALKDIDDLVTECREDLRVEVENAGPAAPRQPVVKEDSESENEEDEEDVPARVGEARRRLRGFLDLKHRAVFFIASAYYQIKSNEDMTEPESEEFKRLEQLEVEGYDKAKEIRNEILQEIHTKAAGYMTELSKRAGSQNFADIPEFVCDLKPGLETRSVQEKFVQLGEALNDQANVVDEWREAVIQLLLKPLVDQEEDEITGEEYENSTKIQGDLMVYTTMLRAAISDRQDALSGLTNERIRHEIKTYELQAKDDEGPSPEKLLALLEAREEVNPTALQVSLRGIISELRELATKLRGDGDTLRTRAESHIVDALLKLVQHEITAQEKANGKLERELALFTSAMNARVEYYRQLQAVSDTVAPYEFMEGEDRAKTYDLRLRDESQYDRVIQTAIASQRYQVHLKNQGHEWSKKTCPICTDEYTVGVLTPCTHEFCRDCLYQWVRAHRKCPICKTVISMNNCHDIVVKKPELRLHQNDDNNNQEGPAGNSPRSQHKTRTRGIFEDLNAATLKEIRDVPLEGPALPTKVDALVRHVIWLRQADPGAKSVIFSQFSGFLDILKRAFDRFQVGYSSFATKDGIARFKEDPAVECFLMDARAHASGLNLVNANHVLLCEPVLNTALELQAIARVDRIGQEHQTNVWLYLVEGTVEESIHNLSVKRRLEHMADATKGTKGKGKGVSTPDISEDNLAVANSLELQQANLPKLMDKDTRLGEVVHQNDLWACLFGHLERESEAQRAAAAADSRFEDRAVVSFLAGRAADERRDAEARIVAEQERVELEERRAAEVRREDEREWVDALAAAGELDVPDEAEDAGSDGM
ncbi:hypothetical protein JX266_001472 [Neoarthrinium moseri]|nr:hypothetical protein JX266_001472 [Neoarthrinium moseri]